MTRDILIRKIQSDIDNYGYHVTIVTGSPYPRFMYTIGLKDKINCELIFAGGENISSEIINSIFHKIYTKSILGISLSDIILDADFFGVFSFSDVDKSWSKLLTLGVSDFYRAEEVNIVQILPQDSGRTLDIPNMQKTLDSNAEPAWKWLLLDWPYSIPRESIAITNIGSLHGEKATEATRWEEGEWEIFVGEGPSVDKKDILIVSLGALLGIDSTLEPIINLEIGQGIWRDREELTWYDWDINT